jgi:hypothetical protein
VELYGESYDRFFDLPEGKVGVLADIYVEGETLVLYNLSVYPVDHERLNAGVRNLLRIRRQMELDALLLGYKRIRITGKRLTGASPGREVDVKRRLA